MPSLIFIVTAWLVLGAGGFTAGVVGIGIARRRLEKSAARLTAASDLASHRRNGASVAPLPVAAEDLVNAS